MKNIEPNHFLASGGSRPWGGGGRGGGGYPVPEIRGGQS